MIEFGFQLEKYAKRDAKIMQIAAAAAAAAATATATATAATSNSGGVGGEVRQRCVSPAGEDVRQTKTLGPWSPCLRRQHLGSSSLSRLCDNFISDPRRAEPLGCLKG